MAVKAKELRYAVELGADRDVRTEDGTALTPAEAWSPEHLLLAALVRCSLASLEYAAGRAGSTVTASSGSARALVTRREADGRYAVVRADVTIDATLEPRPDRATLADVLAKAERDCFVGASLTAKPSYRWNI